MPKKKLVSGRITKSTQKNLDIAEVKDDLVIMKDGSVRAIILVSSINFALKSEDEQNAIISSYVSFLNNIDFPLQIVVQSRELNIDSYLESLKKKEKEQTNELLKMQITDYINNIKELISMGKIMNKRFFVVIPYYPTFENKKNFFSSLLGSLRPASTIKLKEKTFIRYKEAVNRQVESVMLGLSGMGLNVVQLDTQSIIELYYNTYNPQIAKKQKLSDIKDLRIS